jgi:hypothetical protein
MGMKLDLEVWNPGQMATEYKVAVRITNRSAEAVALNRLKIKYWFHYEGTDSLVAASYGYNQTVFSAEGQWIAGVDAPGIQIQSLSLQECSSDRKANRVALISFNDPTSKTIPPGGYVETNPPGDSLATWHRQNWGIFDFSTDYSRVLGLGTSSASRQNSAFIALFLDDVMVCEVLQDGQNDPASGKEPCGEANCAGAQHSPTLTQTPTQTATPTAPFTVTSTSTPTFFATSTISPTLSPTEARTPTATLTQVDSLQKLPRLNLEVWNPGQTDNETKIAVRITNYGCEPVALNRLAVSMWVHHISEHALSPTAYANNQSIYSADGTWRANVEQPFIEGFSLEERVECATDRQATHRIAVIFTDDSSKVIEPNGGYLQTNLGGDVLFSMNLEGWGAIDRSKDYSRITEAGGSSESRTNLKTFALIVDGYPAPEYLPLEGTSIGYYPDENTGVLPCFDAADFIATSPFPREEILPWQVGQAATYRWIKKEQGVVISDLEVGYSVVGKDTENDSYWIETYRGPFLTGPFETYKILLPNLSQMDPKQIFDSISNTTYALRSVFQAGAQLPIATSHSLGSGLKILNGIKEGIVGILARQLSECGAVEQDALVSVPAGTIPCITTSQVTTDSMGVTRETSLSSSNNRPLSSLIRWHVRDNGQQGELLAEESFELVSSLTEGAQSKIPVEPFIRQNSFAPFLLTLP